MYNYGKLLGKIKEKGFSLEVLAKQIGMNVSDILRQGTYWGRGKKC